MKMSMKLSTAFILGSLLTGACSKKEELPKGLFFSGPCRVEVKTTPSDSEIFLDGISVGIGEALVEMPCGEKQIMVKNPGYKPYYAYHPVDVRRALKVAVTLPHLPHGSGDFALSHEIVDQIREGQKVWDESRGPRPEVKDETYPPYLGDMNALLASVKGVSGAGAGAEEAFEEGSWDSVEDWR